MLVVVYQLLSFVYFLSIHEMWGAQMLREKHYYGGHKCAGDMFTLCYNAYRNRRQWSFLIIMQRWSSTLLYCGTAWFCL